MTYSNPAFAALGIKSFKLPSRNWMIFWTVIGSLTGGIIYDKWKQRVLRDEFMEKYKNNNLNFPINEKHRKLRIYVSPPPNDYLDESMKYFRRFVKPIINSSGIDFEIITMERQGDIRYKVAEEIRQLRREKAGLLNNNENNNENEIGIEISNTSSSNVNNHINPIFENFKVDESKKDENNENEIKNLRDLYKPMDVLGVEKIFGNFEDRVLNVKSEDALVNDVRNAGGIICIGRGAYKEYINGVHEGLLGPLEEPIKIEPVDELSNKIEFEDDKDKGKDEKDGKNDKNDDDDDKYAPAAYIYAKDYKDSIISSELGLDKIDFNNENEVSNILQTLKDEKTGIPYFFVQPILELRNYTVAGFTRQPERIWRFYNKRNQLIEYNEKLVELINKKWCKFTNDNLNSGIEEENDWPSSWLKVAKKNNSEWVREFDGDDRVLKLLSTYNCDCNNDDKKV